MSTPKRTLAAFAAGALVTPILPFAAAPAFAAPPDPPPPRSVEAFCQSLPADYQPFTDIGGNTFEDNIECLAAAAITQGGPGNRPEDQYGPELPVRRDAMASFIARLIDAADELDTGDNIEALPAFDGTIDFTDVSPSSVHAQNIDRLAEAGIVNGGPGGRPRDQYGPSFEVTRAQMATFIANALGFMTSEEVTSGNDYFTDDEGAVPHEPRINAIAERAIAVGDGVDTYRPSDSVSRGQMSAFLTRPLALLEEQGDIVPLPFLRVTPDDEDEFTPVANPDEDSSDDRSYTVDGLVQGEEYRITLVVEQNVGTNAEGETTFVDSDNDNLAEVGERTADITMVDGEPAQNNSGDGTESTPTNETNGGTAVFTADDTTATFVVDGDGGGESVQPLVYRNGGEGNGDGDGGQSARLELNDDDTPAEAFDIGGVVRFGDAAAAGIQVAPDSSSTLAPVANPDQDSSDDRNYSVSGLVPDEEFRITLVVEDNIGTNAEGETTFADSDNDNLAEVGERTADITTVNGEPARNNSGDGSESTPTNETNGGTAVFTPDGTTATFVVDGDGGGESVQPVVYRNGGEGNGPEDGGASPRLELNDDGTPAEEFDTGGAVTYDETTSANPTAVTDGPDLVSAAFVRNTVNGDDETTTVRYTFDEGLDTGVDEDSFLLYTFDGEEITTDDDGDNPVTGDPDDARRDSADGASVLVVFPVTADEFADVTLATVDRGAVTDSADTENPIGDAALGDGVDFASGSTSAPDLRSTGNVRTDPSTAGATLVDFVFDEPAFVVDPTSGQFQVIEPNGAERSGTPVPDSATSDPDDAQGDGTTTITVRFTDEDANGDGTADPLTPARIARGVVLTGTVSDERQSDDGNPANGDPAEGAVNPLQATDTDDGGATDLPDLVSATVDQDASTVTYAFDEDVVVTDETLFRVYDRDGSETPGTEVSGNDRDPDDGTVVVTFEPGSLDVVSGASADEGAVTETGTENARGNQEDEVAVQTAPQAAGGTTGPDLTTVNREVETRTTTDPFTGENSTTVTGVTVRFVFDDEANDPDSDPEEGSSFFVVQADGSRTELTDCEEANDTTVEGDENVVVCGTSAQDNRTTPTVDETEEFEAARDAVLSTVAADGVTDDEGTGNPEGAEPIGGASAPEPEMTG